MPSGVSDRANELLQRFYGAGEDDKTALEALIACASPLLRNRFQGKGVTGDDLDELCGEAVERLIEAMRRSQEADRPRIGDYVNYALTVADSVFSDHLRRTRPHWCRLKRRMVAVLDGAGGNTLFARWRLAVWLGGFARWRGQPFRPTPRYRAYCENDALFRREALDNRSPAHRPLPDLMAALFRWIETPLEVDPLTNHLAALQEIHDSSPVSLEGLAAASDMDPDRLLPASPEDVAARILDALATEQRRAEIWRVIVELLPRQRAALLLGMSRSHLLLVAGRADPVAEALAMPPATFAALWPALPLTDSALAERLDATPKQVSNLRKCAREKIARRLNRSDF